MPSPPRPFSPQLPVPPRPGDLLRVVAPAGPFDRTLFWRGLGFLAQTFRVRWTRRIFQREGFVAGQPEARAQELAEAFSCAETRVIVCARGGVGCADLFAPALLQRWAPAAPSGSSVPHKWLVGFSDVTALHTRCQHAGLLSIHAANVTSLGVGCAELRERWLAHLLDPLGAREWTLETLFPGEAEGPLVGGNLAVLHDLAAANQWDPPAGCLLFIEEVAEPPYRIHRMLSALWQSGRLSRVSALVVGQISASHPGPHGSSAKQVLETLCARWKLPAAWGLPSGHEPSRNDPLTLGLRARLVATSTGAMLQFPGT